jgi:hypothetical protein
MMAAFGIMRKSTPFYPYNYGRPQAAASDDRAGLS